MNRMTINVVQQQKLAISQQIIQNISLLQYTGLDLAKLIQNYIEENPFIEEVISIDDPPHIDLSFNAKLDHEKFSPTHYDKNQHDPTFSHSDFYESYSAPRTLREHLLEQTLLCQFDDDCQMLAEAMIDAINEHGQLTMSLEEIRNSHEELFAIDATQFTKVLSVLQGFTPSGVAWRDLKECLLIQLRNLHENDRITEIAEFLVKQNFSSPNKKITMRFLNQSNISHSEYHQARALILSLNPKPFANFASQTNFFIMPDLILTKQQGIWIVSLNDSIFKEIQLNRNYQDLLKIFRQHDSYPTLQHELQQAQLFLQGLKTRNDTLLRVANFIVHEQIDFFQSGPEQMKPLIIQQVAKALDLHESTISRITTGKYIATPTGIFELKYFFSSHVIDHQGNACSAIAVQAHLKRIIATEDKENPYSDHQLVELLDKQGIKLARRTVSKYRESLKLPPAYLRSAKNAVLPDTIL